MSSAPRGLAPREGLELVLMKMGRAGAPLSHAAGRRQASLGTPVPRTPTMHGLFTWANLPILPFILFSSCISGVFLVFGTFRRVIFSCVGVALFTVA